MSKVIEEAVMLYAQSVQKTLRQAIEQNVKDLEAITQTEQLAAEQAKAAEIERENKAFQARQQVSEAHDET